MTKLRETDLYDPVKAYLQAQGYTVKGEVGAVDVMALRDGPEDGPEDDHEPVLVELKLGFSLALLHQGIARQAVSDAVYLAVPRGAGRAWAKAFKGNLGLCRRLGLGLITVRLRDGFVEVHADPLPYRPRKFPRRKGLLLREFARRVGDPNAGGATRAGLVTAYRQDALLLAACLRDHGAQKGARVAHLSGVAHATRMMADDHYGWFERLSPGVYALSPKGATALLAYGNADEDIR